MSNVRPERKAISPQCVPHGDVDVRSPATPSGHAASFDLFDDLAARHEGVMGSQGLITALQALLKQGCDNNMKPELTAGG